MGMYIEIEGEYPCGKCGERITDWQSKELRYHGHPIEPLLQTLALVPGMDGEIHTYHDACGYATEYAVIDGVIADPKDRRETRDGPPPVSATIPPESALAKRLADAAGAPVVVEANGVRYRIEPEDPWAFYDPEKALASLQAAAGAWAGMGLFAPSSPAAHEPVPEDEPHDDGMRRFIRLAKPPKKSVENCAETRYGREMYGNVRYNEALDDYEAAMLARLDHEESNEEPKDDTRREEPIG